MNGPSLRAQLLAEFLGTALLILLGDGVVASVMLLNKHGDWMVITTGWGLAVTFGVYVSARLSGGHLNPAVTLALAARGDFPVARIAPYWLAQLAGAMLGAALVYYDYGAAFAEFEQKNRIVRGQMTDGKLAGPAAGGAGVFATYPAFDDVARNLFSEAIGTAVLMFGVCAITDRRNASVPRFLQPFLVGAVVWAIGLSLGGLTGYAINPARDLGPRIVSALAGWGSAVFYSHSSYFWIPIAGPMIGGVFGAVLYDASIGRQFARTASK